MPRGPTTSRPTGRPASICKATRNGNTPINGKNVFTYWQQEMIVKNCWPATSIWCQLVSLYQGEWLWGTQKHSHLKNIVVITVLSNALRYLLASTVSMRPYKGDEFYYKIWLPWDRCQKLDRFSWSNTSSLVLPCWVQYLFDPLWFSRWSTCHAHKFASSVCPCLTMSYKVTVAWYLLRVRLFPGFTFSLFRNQ